MRSDRSNTRNRELYTCGLPEYKGKKKEIENYCDLVNSLDSPNDFALEQRQYKVIK